MSCQDKKEPSPPVLVSFGGDNISSITLYSTSEKNESQSPAVRWLRPGTNSSSPHSTSHKRQPKPPALGLQHRRVPAPRLGLREAHAGLLHGPDERTAHLAVRQSCRYRVFDDQPDSCPLYMCQIVRRSCLPEWLPEWDPVLTRTLC